MTPNMQKFLARAAEAENGKGVIVQQTDARTAGHAVSQGYGWMMASIFKVFIITEKGRAALSKATAS